ncbi:MAG: ribonuclease E/G [Clostridia bacterium]|nr:ribonuclease E/G [Clostridia bacterium]
MKELYCREKDGGIEIIITSGDEPLAIDQYLTDTPNRSDVIAAMPLNKDKAKDFFFSGIGGKTTAFCDDVMPRKNGIFPAQVVSLPGGTKQYRITPVISFTGLYVFAEFVPFFSKHAVTETFVTSSKLSPSRAVELAEKFREICDNIRFEGYRSVFAMRSLCQEPGSDGAVLSEIKGSSARFGEILRKLAGSSSGRPAGPGEVLYKRTVPEYIVSTVKPTDYGRVTADSPRLSAEFGNFFANAPEKPEIRTVPDFDRLFDTVDGLRKLPKYTGRSLYTGSGARITYDKTEAMHVFDVNSAESVLSSADINKEACEIIARVCSVRNLTGIIMCDFINMRSKNDEAAVIECMRAAVSEDYRPFKIYGFTALKVLECSRYR